jgi:hypothetical protein
MYGSTFKCLKFHDLFALGEISSNTWRAPYIHGFSLYKRGEILCLLISVNNFSVSFEVMILVGVSHV